MFDKKALLVAAALVGLGAACATETIDTFGSDPASGGKADEEPAIAVAPASETLWSNALRALVCEAIVDNASWASVGERDAFDAGCQDHDFTITERRTSTLYAHQDDLAPVTMGMTVKVSDGTRDLEADLNRVWRPDTYRFVWQASAPAGDNAHDTLIRDLADEMGEYFDGDDARLRPIALADIPAAVRQTAEARAADTTERFHELDPEARNGARVSEDEAYEILDPEGETIGYVISLEYYIDDTLFDGGGQTLYLNHLGEIVEAIEWWG